MATKKPMPKKKAIHVKPAHKKTKTAKRIPMNKKNPIDDETDIV